MFYRGSLIFFMYVDDGLFMDPKKSNMNKSIKDLKRSKFEIEYRGRITDYIGINVEKLSGNKLKLTQTLIINQILSDV